MRAQNTSNSGHKHDHGYKAPEECQLLPPAGVPQTLTTPSPCSECMFAVRVLDDLLCDPEATQWLVGTGVPRG